MFKVSYPEERIHLRQWMETLNDFPECYVRILKQSKEVHFEARLGSEASIKLLGSVVVQKNAHRTFFCHKDTFTFWMENKWVETLKHGRKSNVVYILESFAPGNKLQVLTENMSASMNKKKYGKVPIPSNPQAPFVPISECSREGSRSMSIAPPLRKQLLEMISGSYSYVQLPTRQLKTICLHLGPIKSLDDEHPDMFHEVTLDLSPSMLVLSAVDNYRGAGKVEVYAHEEDAKDKVTIRFAPHHPRRFIQKHHLYSMYLFCRNQHPVSEFVTLAFAPHKTLVLHAECKGIAYKRFHLFPLS